MWVSEAEDNESELIRRLFFVSTLFTGSVCEGKASLSKHKEYTPYTGGQDPFIVGNWEGKNSLLYKVKFMKRWDTKIKHKIFREGQPKIMHCGGGA